MLRFQFTPLHPITRVAFTLDGSVVTAQPFVGIAVRDRYTGEARVNIPLERTAAIRALRIHPEFGWLIAHTSRTTMVLDVVTGRLIPLTQFTDGRFFGPLHNSFAVTADGTLSLTLLMGRPMIHHVASTLNLARVNSSLHGLNATESRAVIAFSPDGTKLAIGDGETLSVFTLGRFRHPTVVEQRLPLPLIDPLFTLERPDPARLGTHADRTAEHWLPPVAFDHAGRSLFTLGLRNRVQRIDLATGGVMAEWGWRCEPIRCLAVAPDDLTAAAGCKMGELVVWDLE